VPRKNGDCRLEKGLKGKVKRKRRAKIWINSSKGCPSKKACYFLISLVSSAAADVEQTV
jgi:hypothetical protein